MTVSDVEVAAVTVPTAPLLSATVLLAAVVLKPEPLIVSVLALASTAVVLCVTTGRTVAICTADPLLIELTATTAVKLPAVGRVEKVTVSEVAVAAVTVPTAPLLNVTTLLAAVVLKPKPLIVTVFAVRASAVVAAVTTGPTAATCTAVPLLTLLVVTTAVKLPMLVGLVENVTFSDVAVALVTVPTPPLLNVTVLLAAVVSKPAPAIVIVAALAPRAAVLLVTIGLTVATCTADPLLTPLTLTWAVKLPALGFVE